MKRTAKTNRAGGARVYSTEVGRTCPGCLRAIAACVCRDRSRPTASGGTPGGLTGNVRIRRETKGRKGAGVTLVTGLVLDARSLKDLAKHLKTVCGVGGAVKDGVIELQGDHRERVRELLAAEGIEAKLAGG